MWIGSWISLPSVTLNSKDILKELLVTLLQAKLKNKFSLIAMEEGLNGKTTFLNVTSSLAGDYGRSVPIDLFLHNNRSNAAQGHTESLANVQGKRFIMPGELEIRARLAMGLLKTLTGKDALKASHKGERKSIFNPFVKSGYSAIINRS